METPRTIAGIVARSVELFGERTAVEDAGLRVSFRELAARAKRVAAALIQAGVQPGDRVAIWAPNGLPWIDVALGAAFARATIVPINTRWKPLEAGFALEKSRARVLFTRAEFLGTRYFDGLRAAMPGLPVLEKTILLDAPSDGAIALDHFLMQGVDLDVVRTRVASARPDDVSDIMFTSGTTGHPKGVATTHEQNIRAFRAWSDAVGLTAGDRYLIVNPFFHSFGFKAGILACILTGATMLPHAVFDPDAVIERLSRESISVLPGPPTLYQSLLAHSQLTAAKLPQLRLAVTGAAVVPLELIQRMNTELGFQTIITGYGLTESCGIATMCRAGDDLQTIASSSGRAIEGVDVRVVDPEGRAQPPGTPGEVVIRGYNVMQGYFEAPEQTREVIDAEGFLHTGDIGLMDERGNLRITDRLKDMYIAGGFNCYPAEIERVIATHPGVAQVAVIGIPDDRLGEVGMAFIVPRAGHFADVKSESGEVSEAAWSEPLTAFCRANLANYKVPRRFARVSELPLNASGKVVKARLRESVASAH